MASSNCGLKRDLQLLKSALNTCQQLVGWIYCLAEIKLE